MIHIDPFNNICRAENILRNTTINPVMIHSLCSNYCAGWSSSIFTVSCNVFT